MTDLTDDQAVLLDRLVECYPAAAAYSADRDPSVFAVARPLIGSGAIERVEVEEDGEAMVAYRLTPTTVAELTYIACAAAGWAETN